MATPTRLNIPGCKPSLVGYLKALGLLKSISLQFDEDVTGFYQGEEFFIETSLEKEELIACFAKHYRPLLILSPFTNDRNSMLFEELKKSQNPRLSNLQAAYESYESFKDNLINLNSPFPSTKWLQDVEKQLKTLSPEHITSYRALAMGFCELGEVLKDSTDSQLDINYQSALARLKIEENYLAAISLLIDFHSTSPRKEAEKLFFESIFLECKITTESVHPYKTCKFDNWEDLEVNFKGNPWDYILVLNGYISLCKDYPLLSKIPLPFCLKAIGYNWNMAVGNHLRKTSKRELWLPLWNRPLRYQEITKVLLKFAISLTESSIYSGLDLAFEGAIWGINPFLANFLRVGLSFDAITSILPEVTNLGYIKLKEAEFPENINPIRVWVSSLQDYLDESPKSYQQKQALNDLEASLFAYLVGLEKSFIPTLINLGVFHEKSSLLPKTKRPKPLVLPHQILEMASENTTEFRIALAIASLDFSQPVRSCFEPVFQTDDGNWLWSNSSSVLSGALIDKLCQLLEVKLNYAKIHNFKNLPLTSYHPARQSDVELYLAGKTDDRYLEALLKGLLLINYPRPTEKTTLKPNDSDLLGFYLLLRCAFLSSHDYETLMKLIRRLRFSSLTESLAITKELAKVSDYPSSPKFLPSLNLNQRILSSIIIHSI
ncbi:MAG: type I-U CRISPR-associated protein Csx17 [Firmicutes bacterium]|nr:type I-U CRISPR-associated protein Csx17 [Bacillota bacterium]MDD4264040.1 type I-U CRISPR-associated protein Csx17 [Bacillota bacterium]MDD4694156.1 type I-U CRISPR-associated protein Csx17 [Bacillota bacterium]